MGNSLLKFKEHFIVWKKRNRLMFEFLSQNILSIYVKKRMILSPVYNLYTTVGGGWGIHVTNPIEGRQSKTKEKKTKNNKDKEVEICPHTLLIIILSNINGLSPS